MRKIESQMVGALLRRQAWESGNTRVSPYLNDKGELRAGVYLHGNHIATVGYKPADNAQRAPRIVSLAITWAGWETRTTASRLNAVLDLLPGMRGVGLNKGNAEMRTRGHNLPMDPNHWYIADSEGMD